MRAYYTPAASTRQALVEQDLAHIENVLLRVGRDVVGNRVLPPAYWRERLCLIRDCGWLKKADLEKINALLVLLDRWLTSGAPNEPSDKGAARKAKKAAQGQLETIPEALRGRLEARIT